jgi:putative membrane-bound dehydrogenase-like protein
MTPATAIMLHLIPGNGFSGSQRLKPAIQWPLKPPLGCVATRHPDTEFGPAIAVGPAPMKKLLQAAITAGILLAACLSASAQDLMPRTPGSDDEAFLFTPSGFDKPGRPVWAEGRDTGELRLIIRSAETGRPTPCRVNVVGRDGNFYQPAADRLSPYALTGSWPAGSRGNRVGKAPFRYLGRFFYTTGETAVRVPAGKVRVEVWKGYEHTPQIVETRVAAGGVQNLDLTLTRAVSMAEQGWFVGDAHLHFERGSEEQDALIFDLLEAEDLRVGCCLAYNDPAGPYAGFMEKLAFPQSGGLGRASLRSRHGVSIVSGQEFRSAIFGHLNLYLLDSLVHPGEQLHADRWPTQGTVGRQAIERKAYAVAAHGGYASELYANAALGDVSAVELLQFGIYRGIALQGWYDMLSSGWRLPATGSSDYPPCRFLADCRTYVRLEAGNATRPPSLPDWLAGMAAGRSFVTTGPLLLLEVDGAMPGAVLTKTGPGPHRLTARVRMRCEVTPVTDLELIINGRTVARRQIPRAESQGRWIELRHEIELGESAWIAARAHSLAPIGLPDAEAHTNPVFVHLDGRAPFNPAALDAWAARIGKEIARHQARRDFPERAKVLAYFQSALDLLQTVRARGGLPSGADPRTLLPATAPPPEPAADQPKDDLKARLKPVPPKTPAEALRTFETLPDFEMQIVAAEPMVRSPIAAAIDEDGALYVAEMRDYPYNADQPVKVARQRPAPPGSKHLGTVRLLRDTDGDGRMDVSTVFADDLLWPAGIAPWKGGVFVCAPPSIWYLKDTDGDGVADIRRLVFTGFGAENQQAMVNNLQWGPDHRIHASTAGNGGRIRRPGEPESAAVSVHGRDFSFDPETLELELETGTRQFGLSFDDWGNRFLCSQAEACALVTLPLRYLRRQPHFATSAAIVALAPVPEPIFRISPVETWRHLRSERRLAEGKRDPRGPGVSHHVIDAAAGITIYRGGAYPPGFYGNAFVGDGQDNLVHRRVLRPEGAILASRRADAGTEFVRSSDIWFRPVNFVNAPDGTLWCVDMSREYLETVNIPADIEQHLDLTSGRDQGRIYRMAPKGFTPPPPPRLSRATVAELVAALESPHGWWRDTAHRLLFERKAVAAAPALARLAAAAEKAPAARVAALWSLRGLGRLDESVLLAALSAAHPGVRVNALRLAEPMFDTSPALRAAALALLDDPDPQVRFQLAFTIGESRAWDQAAALARLVRKNPADPWIAAAILSSTADCGAALFALLSRDKESRGFQARLLTVLGAQNHPDSLDKSITALAELAEPAEALPLAAALCEGLKRAGATLAKADPGAKLAPLLQHAASLAGDTSRPEPARLTAIALLAHLPAAEGVPALLRLLVPTEPPALQTAALGALDSLADPAIGPAVIERLPALGPSPRAAALDLLLRRADRLEALLAALEKGALRPADLGPTHAEALRRHREPKVRQRAATVLGHASVASRQAVYETFLPALQLKGDPAKGRAHFEARCAACHRLGDIGLDFGPSLAAASAGGREKLLTGILDPNRELLPQFTAYTLDTRAGETFTGLIRAETAAAVTLALPGGQERIISRAGIASLRSLGVSLMPEGLEAGLTPADLADLISFILQAAQSRHTGVGP